MVERTAILLGLSLLLVGIIVATKSWSAWRVARLRSSGEDRFWSALGERPDGRPSLIVFSTPGCVACRTTQHPAVELVSARFGRGLRVMNVDIARHPAVGRVFNVLTAPTTVILGGDGRIERYNHGFAPAEVLTAQVSALVASPA